MVLFNGMGGTSALQAHYRKPLADRRYPTNTLQFICGSLKLLAWASRPGSMPMEQEPQSSGEFNRFYARVFALCAALILAVACYRIVEPFAGPLIWAMFFSFLLHPTHVRLTRRLRNKPERSAWILTIVAFLVIVGPLAAFGAAFVSQASQLLQHAQGVVATDTRSGLQQLTSHPVLQNLLIWMQTNLGITTGQIRGWLTEAARAVLQFLAGASGQLFLGALGTVVGLCVTIFLMFFFIRDGATILITARALVPMPPAKRQALFAYLGAVTRAVVFGTGLTALIQGALVGVAFLMVGLPAPLVFGALAALAALLPMGGTAVIWLPAAIVLAVQNRWIAAIFLLVWGGLLVSMIDNFLKPMLISGRAQVPTLLVFVGVLGGVSAFGATGLFLGPIVLALVLALIRFALETKRERQYRRLSA